MRENIILKCTECGEENYINTKNKRNHPDRMAPLNLGNLKWGTLRTLFSLLSVIIIILYRD